MKGKWNSDGGWRWGLHVFREIYPPSYDCFAAETRQTERV